MIDLYQLLVLKVQRGTCRSNLVLDICFISKYYVFKLFPIVNIFWTFVARKNFYNAVQFSIMRVRSTQWKKKYQAKQRITICFSFFFKVCWAVGTSYRVSIWKQFNSRLLINYKESNLCYSSRMAARKSNNHVTDVITATRGVEYRVRLTT